MSGGRAARRLAAPTRAQDGEISEADARAAVARLDPLWDELFPAEQTRFIDALRPSPRHAFDATAGALSGEPASSVNRSDLRLGTLGRQHETVELRHDRTTVVGIDAHQASDRRALLGPGNETVLLGQALYPV